MSRIVNTIASRLSLRAPQRQSLEILARVCDIANPKKGADLASMLKIIQTEYPRDISLNRFGAWQAIHKGTRQHWGNRTVIFTDLRHEVLREVLAEDFKGHEFEFEPSLRGQVEEFVAQSMDLEVEEKLNDPFWRKVYLDAYKFERGDFAVSLGPDEKRGKHWPRLVRSEGRVEIDCDGMPFIENLAHYTTGVLNCDTQEWRSF